MPTIKLTPVSVANGAVPSIAVQGDTIHITWWNSGLRYPYMRSTDGGHCFEPLRELAPDSVGRVGRCWLIPGSDVVHGIFEATVNGGAWFTGYYTESSDHGSTWKASVLFPDSLTYHSAAGLGDTVAIVANRPRGGYYNILLSTNAGDEWTFPTGSYYFQENWPRLALTKGLLHLVRGTSYDSAGYYAEFVTTYKKSTDLGVTWSDSIPLSTVNFTRAYESYMSADDQGDSSIILSAWKDEKYGCLTPVGCSVIARWSLDNGNTFQPEMRMDDIPDGYFTSTAARGDVMVVGWIVDELPLGGVKVRISTDRGISWCPAFKATNSATDQAVGISNSAIHVAWDAIDTSTGLLHIYYRRGVFQSKYDRNWIIYQPGWNLVSLPLSAADGRRASIFPSSRSDAFSYAAGYVPQDTLTLGKGYWVKFNDPLEACYHGDSVSTDTSDVIPGWNLIGSISTPVAFSAIQTMPNGIIASKLYAYSGTGYVTADTISPGKGYWVKVKQSGKVILMKQ